jgi:hypothetical protein
MGNDNNNPDLVSHSNVCSLVHFRSTKNHRSNLIMSMTQQLVTHNNQYLFTPQNLTEAMDYAKMIATSSFCPKGMQGKPGDVLIAIQMGAEVGLSPMQALQNIAIINGRPCIWGDAALALVQVSPFYVSHREWEESTTDGLIAYCAIIRKGSEEYVKSFSEKDAKKAGLWSKAGVWQQYPSRMLQMRARGFALRDKFSDALKGLSIREEVEDYQEPQRPKVVPIIQTQTIEVKQISKQEQVEYDHDEFMTAVSEINNCKNEDELRTIFTVAWKNPKIICNAQAKNNLYKVKEEKKLKLGREEFLADYDTDTGEVAQSSEEVAS